MLAIIDAGRQHVPAAEPLPPHARRVLDRFLGAWETSATIRRTGIDRTNIDEAIHTRGRAQCDRTLDGRYYEFRTTTIPAGDSELQVMTYDDQADVFRQWVFSSDGYWHAATGVWEATTSTLRWSGSSGTSTFVIDDRFASADRLDWTLTRHDEGGQLVQTISGTLHRTAASHTARQSSSAERTAIP